MLVCKHWLAVHVAKGTRRFREVKVVDEIDFLPTIEGFRADFVVYKEGKPRNIKYM